MSFSFWLSIYDSWFAWEYGRIHWPYTLAYNSQTQNQRYQSQIQRPLQRGYVVLNVGQTWGLLTAPLSEFAIVCSWFIWVYSTVILFDIYLELQTTSFKLMFGETSIVYVNIWNYPIETIIYKSMFQVPGEYMRVASATGQINQFRATRDTSGLYVARKQGRHQHKSAAEPGGFEWVDSVWKDSWIHFKSLVKCPDCSSKSWWVCLWA